MKIKLTRKQAAPPNLAAKALRQGQFQPKVEQNPKAYSRKGRRRARIESESGPSLVQESSSASFTSACFFLPKESLSAPSAERSARLAL